MLGRTMVLGAVASLAAALVGCGGDSGSSSKLGTAGCQLVSRPSARLLLSDTVLARLTARAKAKDPAWTALAAKCDTYATGSMLAPNGNAYPDLPNVGSGYQGEDYVPPMMSLGLCYRIATGAGLTARAASYGTAGATLLDAISTPASDGGATPSTDSGYGIRNYGVAMAYGFDWLYPVLSQTSRDRAIATMNAWVDWYDASGFSKDQPIGNYFVGYLLAKTATAIATEGDNPQAGAYWDDVQNHLYGKLVKPAFTAAMSGGGWPEGWEYGPRAVRAVAEFFWMAKSGKGTTWFDDIPQVRDQAAFLRYFAWPSLGRMNDDGTVRSGAKIAPSASLAIELAGILGYAGDASAGTARSFAADVLATSGDDTSPWQKFLFWDTTLPKDDYAKRPLSYAANGPGKLAARSSWAKDATWVSLSGGRYIDAPDSGEQLFDQGNVSVVFGGVPVLVNPTGWIPDVAGTSGEDFIYQDSWGARTRKLYNTFFVNDAANPYNPGQSGASETEAKTAIDHYEEATGFVRARAARLEDMYKGGVVTQFTRDVVYVRPGATVIFDRTAVAHGSNDQWLAFHTAGAPSPTATPSGTRYDVKDASGKTIGALQPLLPSSAKTQVSSLPGNVTRLEEHSSGAAQEWLTVVTTGASAPKTVRMSKADGNVTSGNVVGVHFQGASDQVVLLPADQAGTATTSAASYTLENVTSDSDQILVDVAPSASGYSVTATKNGSSLTIQVTKGGPIQPTKGGNLTFRVAASGTVSSTGWTAVAPAASSTGTSDGSTAQDPGAGGAGLGGTGGMPTCN